jgi:hypothetical protein
MAVFKETKATLDALLKDGLKWERITGADGVRRFRLPDLLTAREIGGIFRLSYGGTLRFIRRNLRPLGAVSYTGEKGGRVLVHSWGVLKLLDMDERCPCCNRPWLNEGNGKGEKSG